ncbi:MAG: hypothetical protein M3443_10840 [Actinomycetota bacterium]|nr:hypothetical protein [Actinomycetota bacterium]
MADVCRCHLPVDPPDGCGPHWWPSRHPEPATSVQAVALVGRDPRFLRVERRGGQWYSAGLGAAHPESPQPKGWGDVGRCWNGVEHAVVDVTDRLIR